MTAFAFPGQGSQTKGMGGNLFDEFPEFTTKANQLLGYSIKALCLEDPEQQFVAGHSLGEYNALLASEVFDFETGLKLVQKRGELMSQATGGGMAAVVGLSTTDIEKILKESQTFTVTIANYNSSIQTVLSGPAEDIQRVQPFFEKSGMFIPLKVSGAFHSPYMQDAQQEFSQFLSQFTFEAHKISVIANVNAQPYQANQIHSNLLTQLT